MIACVDVDYRESEAVAACVLFDDWQSAEASGTRIERIAPVAPYEPGQFYRRELPCLLRVLESVRAEVTTVLVDGYVWLKDETTPGLGGHLYTALGKTIPVIGVAKTRFATAVLAQPVFRGDSLKPLFVTAAGMEGEEAAQRIKKMHGPYRLPTLLRLVDHLCRTA